MSRREELQRAEVHRLYEEMREAAREASERLTDLLAKIDAKHAQGNDHHA